MTQPVPPQCLLSDATAPVRRRRGAIVLAALALPGVCATPIAHAESAPEAGVVSFKYLRYEDRQPGFKRIKVDSPSLYLATPLGRDWAVEGSFVVDSLSGATPRWQSTVSTASTMDDNRKAGDLKVTRYFDRSSYSVGGSRSSENDYTSNAVSLGGTWSSADNNRTWNLGLGAASDRIDPVNGGVNNVRGETKKTREVIGGITQALSSTDIVQLNVSHSHSEGCLSDPYKTLDNRPRERKQGAVLARWNHHVEGLGASLRMSYRYYHDSYKIRAHTLQTEWAQPVSDRLVLTPLVRLYTQSSASFYVDSQTDGSGFPIFPTVARGQLNSGDQRLSAFGAVTLGLKAEYRINKLWSIDGKFESYQQRIDWRLGGSGSTGLDTFRASFVQLGTSHKF